MTGLTRRRWQSIRRRLRVGCEVRDASGRCHKWFAHMSLTDPHPQPRAHGQMSHGAVGTHGAQAALLLTPLKPPRVSSPAVSLSCPPESQPGGAFTNAWPVLCLTAFHGPQNRALPGSGLCSCHRACFSCLKCCDFVGPRTSADVLPHTCSPHPSRHHPLDLGSTVTSGNPCLDPPSPS